MEKASMTEIEQLKQIALAPEMPMDQRSEAATLLIRLEEEAIRSEGVEDDDPEVLKLLQPWSRDTPTNAMIADMVANYTGGRSINGYSLPDARAEVLERRILRLRLAVAVDEALPLTVREAAVDAIRRDPSRPYYSRACLDMIKQPTDTKSSERGPVQVVRPPREFVDVW